MSNGGDVEPMWEADLIQGAVAEAASTGTNLRDAVQGSSFDAVLPDGTVLKNADGGMGDIASGQHFATPSEERAREAILSAVGKAGLGLTSLQFFNVDGLEPQLTVVTHDPKATAQQLASLEKELFGSPPSYDGYYLAINMANGAPLARQSTSFRTGAGRFWIDPKYANSSTVATFGLYRPS